MPRIDKFLAPEVQKHKRNAEYMEEGWARKGGGKASGNRRSWAMEDRESWRRRPTGNRLSERGLS